MSREKLLQARSLIQEKRFDEARIILRSMPNDPTAQKWLAKLNEIAPEKPRASRKPAHRLILGSVIAVALVVMALILLWGFMLSDNGDGKKPETYTAEDLSRALLTLDDMPSGWTIHPAEGDDEEGETESDSSFFCGHDELDMDGRALGNTEVMLSGGEIAPVVVHAVNVYSADEADKIFAEFTGIFEDCEEWEDEDEYTWHAAEMSFPKLGDDSAAYRLSTSDVPLVGVMEIQVVLIRSDSFLSVIMHMDIGFDGVDTEQTEQFARRADEKLQDIIE